MKRSLLRDSFMQITSDKEKQLLSKALEKSIEQLLAVGNSIYLEEFGIISPRIVQTNQNFIHEEKSLVRKVQIGSLEFHKCGQLTTFHREKFPSLIEEKQLAQTVLAKLPLHLQAEWGFATCKRLIRGLVETIKHETITRGHSARISGLGEFYALHNRQGAAFTDWFAGSDIILKPAREKIISCEDCRAYERPILHDAWEMLSVLYGKAIHVFSLNIADELKKLGYTLDKNDLGSDAPDKIKIAVFANKSSGKQQLIYCTNGLRNLGLRAGKSSSGKSSSAPYGVELVFQAAADSDFRDSSRDSSQKHDDLLLPDWPRSIIVMGWVLLQSSKNRVAKIGAGMSFNTKLCPDLEKCKLSAIFTTGFTRCKSELLSNEGPFYYINLVGITEDEARLAESYSPRILGILLEHKNLDQVTKIGRSSILNRAAFLEIDQNLQKVNNNRKEGAAEQRSAASA